MVPLFAYSLTNTTYSNCAWPYGLGNFNYPTAAVNVHPPPKPGRMRAVFDWRSNRVNPVSVPPVLLTDCTKERYPKPLVVRLATIDWCCRRLAARRRHLPLRSRPGVR